MQYLKVICIFKNILSSGQKWCVCACVGKDMLKHREHRESWQANQDYKDTQQVPLAFKDIFPTPDLQS